MILVFLLYLCFTIACCKVTALYLKTIYILETAKIFRILRIIMFVISFNELVCESNVRFALSNLDWLLLGRPCAK